MFRSSDGPKMVVGILKDGNESLEILDTGFAVVAAAATGNEVVKELLMELKIDELILEVLNRQSKGNIQGLYDSIRVLLTPDDNRVVASQVSKCFITKIQISVQSINLYVRCEVTHVFTSKYLCT